VRKEVWRLPLSFACAVHGKYLVERCPRCGKQLSLDRGTAVLCRCGLDLRTVKANTVSEDARAAQELLERVQWTQHEDCDLRGQLRLARLLTARGRRNAYPVDTRMRICSVARWILKCPGRLLQSLAEALDQAGPLPRHRAFHSEMQINIVDFLRACRAEREGTPGAVLYEQWAAAREPLAQGRPWQPLSVDSSRDAASNFVPIESLVEHQIDWTASVEQDDEGTLWQGYPEDMDVACRLRFPLGIAKSLVGDYCAARAKFMTYGEAREALGLRTVRHVRAMVAQGIVRAGRLRPLRCREPLVAIDDVRRLLDRLAERAADVTAMTTGIRTISELSIAGKPSGPSFGAALLAVLRGERTVYRTVACGTSLTAFGVGAE
jgi:hypothetical protein